MKTKKIILFLIICIIGVSLVNATEDNTTQCTQDNILSTQTNPVQENYIIENSTHVADKNNIQQDNTKTNIKQDTTPKTIILNNTNYDEYITDTMFNDKVNSGDTIDIQGFLDGNFPITVNKPLNITSTTNDAYITHDQRGNSGDPENYILRFKIINEGSGTNISNIKFHNVHFYTENYAHDIHINNITMTCNAMVGMGRGMISIREGASNVTINNSYFAATNNGGHSIVVFHYAQNCVFENNTIEGHGMCGNLLYLTTYGGIEDTGETDVVYGNVNNTIRYNLINGMDVGPEFAICYPFVFEGANLTFENNIILRPERGIITQVNDYGTNVVNTTMKNIYMPYAERDYITDETLNDYGILDSEGVYTLLNNTNRKSFIITAQNISTVINNYGATINAMSPNIHTLISNVSNSGYTFERLYAPNTTVITYHPVNVKNSTVKQLILYNSSNITNSIIINKENNTIISYNTNNDTNILENYLISYNNETIKYGDSTISIVNGTLNNNGPNLRNITVLTNENYYTIFDEDYTLKENITGTIMAIENITNPVIIDKEVNLTTAINQFTNYTIFANLTIELSRMRNNSNVIMEDYFGHYTYYDNLYQIIDGPIYTYSNVTFLNGSQNSNVTNSIVKNIQIKTDKINIQNSSFYEKIILNNSHNSNLINNQLFGNNSTIILINSTNNNIQDNIIHNKDEYTIILDGTSIQNVIKDNNLESKKSIENQTIFKGGIDTVEYTPKNMLEHNTPYRNVTIAINSNDIVTYNLKNNITINITYNNKPVTEGKVIGLYNGTQIFNENLTNGTITTTFIPQNIGVSDIKIWYISPGDIYNTIGAYKRVTSRSINTTLTIDADTTKIGEDITVIATLLDEFNNTIDNETVIIKVGSDEYPINTREGVVIFNAMTNETWFTYGVQAIFNQTNSYYGSISNKITLEKGDALLDIKQKVVGDKLVVTVNVTDVNGVPVTGGRVRFRGFTSANPTISDGIVTYEIPLANVTEGMNITANFTNNNAFNTKFETITLTLDPPKITNVNIDEVVGKTNQLTTLTATVTTDNQVPVSNGSVRFSVGEFSQTVSVEDGVATLSYIFTEKLNDTLTVEYIPISLDDYYGSVNTTTIIITKDSENVTLILSPITGKINEEVTITASIATKENMPINEGQVTFTTTNYEETVNVINGMATITHIFTQTLNNTITATYTPENLEDYNPQTNTTTITIIEDNKELTLKINTTNFIIGQTNTITANIYLDDTIATDINKGKVVFKVNGKTLKDTNGKVIYAKVINGTATIENYVVPSSWTKENTTIQAVYSGSTQLESLKSDKETITITKQAPAVTLTDMLASKGESIQINIQVTQGQTPINTGKIVVKINGKTLKDTNGKIIYATVNNGIATINYTIPSNMKVNNYNLTVVFISSDYERVENTVKLTIE